MITHGRPPLHLQTLTITFRPNQTVCGDVDLNAAAEYCAAIPDAFWEPHPVHAYSNRFIRIVHLERLIFRVIRKLL